MGLPDGLSMSAKRLQNCLNISDLRQAARKRAHKMVFDYIDGGAEDEVTLARNASAFADYELLYRVLAGVEQVDMSTRLLGHTLDVPFFLSPSAGNRLFHKNGERAVAPAAQTYGTAYCLSTLSSVSIEEIGGLVHTPKFFQLYVWNDRTLVKEMLTRAKAAGFTALILTVDLPVHGNRERDPRNGFTIPPEMGVRQIWEAVKRPHWTWDYLTSPSISYANVSAAQPAETLESYVSAKLHAGFDWAEAEWLLGEWNGPAMLKGVVRADDAQQAVKSGFNAVQISNHGGRQLDGTPAPISVLETIRQAVGSDAELVLDGGIRRGTDILKALALGADAVSFARPYLYGLAAGGAVGVHRALEILTAELRRDMVLLGVGSVAEISRDFVKHSNFAFPSKI